LSQNVVNRLQVTINNFYVLDYSTKRRHYVKLFSSQSINYNRKPVSNHGNQVYKSYLIYLSDSIQVLQIPIKDQENKSVIDVVWLQ